MSTDTINGHLNRTVIKVKSKIATYMHINDDRVDIFYTNKFNPLVGTLKPQSNGLLYNNTVIGTLAVDGWAVKFGKAKRSLGGQRPRPVPSSCPSHAGIVCKRLYKVFPPSDSPIIQVFPNQTGWQYSDGDSPNGGVECKGGMKKSRLSTNIGVYLRTDAR